MPRAFLPGRTLRLINVPFGAHWYIGNNAIQFWNVKLLGSLAVTLGNVALYGADLTPESIGQHEYIPQNPPDVVWGVHEGAHTWQQQRLGPFFLPLYPVFYRAFERPAEDFGAGLAK